MTTTPILPNDKLTRPTPPRRVSRGRKQARIGRAYYPFLIPAIVILGVFSLYPLVQLVRMAFSTVRAATLNEPWVFAGLDNFILDFQRGSLDNAAVNTVIFVSVVTIIGLIGGLGAAIALRETRPGSGFLLALMVFCWALPPVVSGSVWKFLFADAGLFNTLLGLVGMPHIGFLYDIHLALVSVALVNSWSVVPFNALVFRAAIMNIPIDTFEAAQLDGARPLQVIRYVIVPAMRPTTLVLAVLTIVYGFRSFDYIYVMTYGGPGTATSTLPFLGYLQAIVNYNFGLGSATSILTVILAMILAFIYARSIRSEENES